MKDKQKRVIKDFFEELGKDIEGGCDMSDEANKLIKKLENVRKR